MPIVNGIPVGEAVTGGYRPHVYGYLFGQLADQDKWFTIWDVEQMRRDPRCRLGYAILCGPAYQAKYEVKGTPRVTAWVKATLERIWRNDLHKMLSFLEYGRSGGEIVWKAENGLVQWDFFNVIHPWDLRPRELHGKVCGVNVVNVPGIGTCKLGTPKSFYLVHEPSFNKYYGRSRYESAWIPWQEKTAKHGARDSRRTWYAKGSHAGGLMRHPSGVMERLPDGTVRSYEEVGRRIVELYQAGGVMAIPNDRDEKGNYTWDWTPPQVLGELSDVREFVKDLDVEILEGMEIPSEIVTAGDTGGWSGRSVPFIIFLTGEDRIVSSVLSALDEQALRPAAIANFGAEGRQYTLTPVSLVPPASPEGGRPGPEGAAPGGPKPPRSPEGGKRPSSNVRTGGQEGVPARLGMDEDRETLAKAVEDAAAETDTNPSEDQKKAGNYAKGKVRLHGLEIAIENPRGSERSGKDTGGKPWSVTMGHHYGYIKRTESEADGDHVDVFLGPHPWSEAVFVVNQRKADGSFDEHKVLLGFTSAAEAKQAYLDCYSPGWKGFGGLVPMTLPRFKEWLENEDMSEPVRLAHDVSGEARDPEGRWKGLAERQQKRRLAAAESWHARQFRRVLTTMQDRIFSRIQQSPKLNDPVFVAAKRASETHLQLPWRLHAKEWRAVAEKAREVGKTDRPQLNEDIARRAERIAAHWEEFKPKVPLPAKVEDKITAKESAENKRRVESKAKAERVKAREERNRGVRERNARRGEIRTAMERGQEHADETERQAADFDAADSPHHAAVVKAGERLAEADTVRERLVALEHVRKVAALGAANLKGDPEHYFPVKGMEQVALEAGKGIKHLRRVMELREGLKAGRLAHDVSGEKRDEEGKWTAGSGKPKSSRGEMVGATRIGKGKDAKVVLADGSEAPSHIKPSMIPPQWSGVTVGIDPDADVLVQGRDKAGRSKTVYADSFHARNAALKFARVREGVEKKEAIYRENQENRADPAKREEADCVWLMQEQATRPGSDKDTKARTKAYGATTLRAEHVVEKEDGVHLDFIGKEGVHHDHRIGNPELAGMLLDRKASAGEREGKLFGTDYEKVHAYSKTLDGGHFTPKDFRTVKATTLAIEAVNERPDCCKTLKEYKIAVKAVAEKVSGVLGNKPAQALASYIDPTVFASWRSRCAACS